MLLIEHVFILEISKLPYSTIKYSVTDLGLQVTRHGSVEYFTDVLNPETSNWVRWVNCARNAEEENVMYAICKGRVFYLLIKDVAPGTELLVYYGYTYAQSLGINYKHKKISN